MDTTKTMHESESLIQWLDKTIDEPEIPSNEKARFAAGCLDVAREHNKAIVLLVAHNHYGSAFALARLIFEAYVRGVWLWRCASVTEIQRYKTGKLKKEFGELIQDVEKLDGFEECVLSDIKTRSWKMLNSFTHSGYDQVMRRNTDTTIEPNYKDSEILDLLNFTNVVGLLTGMAIAYMAERETLAVAILEKAKTFWND